MTTSDEQTVNKFYVGIIMKEDGWYRMYSDGHNHFMYEKIES